MNATFSAHVAMSDFFRALAGAPDAQYDLIACTVYSAAYSIMQAGNKTQFAKLEADAKQYGGDSTDCTKAIKAALGVDRVNADVKHFRKVYFAVGVALAQLPAPALVKDLPKGKAEISAILSPLADDYAQQFTSIFVNALTLTEKTGEEQAAAKETRAANKAAKDKAAAKELDQKIKAEAEKLAQAQVVTLADMVRMVTHALVAGQLEADDEARLIEAAQTRETALLLARVAESAPAEAVH